MRGTITNPMMGSIPNPENAMNMAAASLRLSALSSSSGTGRASSSVIMMLRKKVLYFAMMEITVVASMATSPDSRRGPPSPAPLPPGSCPAPMSPAPTPLRTYLLYERVERNSPTLMLSASASTFDTPIANNADVRTHCARDDRKGSQDTIKSPEDD
eukprot:CAMPEP_0205875948 /NCGR_PEP_ID=MMETSP1083-20121108/13533_1 /ASSEMBLY_ACC=CAM_ASM_000430 /TAXON_ID=97485 /ORGANISM="Prymnesium parvum, Strain Texoma1" /LENGTH=156 /DNA_ID=CAMNT_0053238669 /DNA_START=865 /DNA_END=1335 /DNA_ORIENTATION=-